MTKRYFFGISALIHLGIAGLIFYHIEIQTNSKREQVVQLTFQNSPSPKVKQRVQKTLAQKMRFLPSLNSGFHRQAPAASQESTQDSSAWTQLESYQATDMDHFQGLSIKQAQYLKSVWTEINESIAHSPYLAEYGQTGIVHLQFEISPKGLLVNETFKAKTDNNILKVFAARSVRKALRSDNIDLQAPDEVVRIFARFQWTDQTPCEAHQGMNKNYLSFCRISKSAKKSFSTAEKAGAYLSSIQYGLGALEEIEKYKKEENRRNTQFDPFQDIKRDLDWNLGT